jgi:general secretion pathway protein D
MIFLFSSESPFMKRAIFNVPLLFALGMVSASAQEPAPAVQTQVPSTTTTVAPVSPGQTMGAPLADTNAPPTATQTSGLLSPPPDNPPAVTPAPAPVATPPPVTSPVATPTTPSSRPVTHQDIEHIQQQEVIRRQELIFRADHAMADGRRAELGTRFPEARQNYLFAAQAYGSVSRSSARFHRAAEGLARVDFQLYDASLQAGDTARAKLLIDEIVAYNPDNKVAQEKQARTNAAIANPNDTSILGNPAVTPGFIKRVNEVGQLFSEAEQFRRTGQWDEAETRLKTILGIDPYNMAATRQLERIVAEKNQYADEARLETRKERLRQVEEKWYQPIINKETPITAQESQPILNRANNFDIDQKLKSIFISPDFTNVSIEQATNFLFTESKRLDEPTHKGIPFIIQPDASTSAKPISMTLNNVPIGEALRYICQLANVKYKVQDYAISIVPFTATTDDLISRTFNVQPSFISNASSPADSGDTAFGLLGGGTTATRRPISPILNPKTTTQADTAQAALEAKGVKFPPGASAVYTTTTGTLTVVDTADQMELIEELVNGAQAPTLMVRIATKFVEINQTDLNDLTFNGSFNIVGTSGTGLPAFPGMILPRAATSLPGAGGFTPDGIDQLITPANNAENALRINGSLSGLQFTAFVSALSQKRSFDELAEPAALTKSGEQATLEAIRVFPYPVAFDPPELVTQQTQTTSITVVSTSPPTVIPTTPTDFKRRDIGVRLVIKPQVTADDKTVDLSLFPEVTDFEGFVNYGAAIFIGNPDGSTSLLSSNDINQPVFNTRRINTKVLIHDGSTVVLGGLIRDDVQTINDRVPILGDIPLLGRLFQSKATESTKRNLIIFVTANIYQNDGELLNPPEVINAADVLTGRAAYVAPASP